jgi:peptidyl-prolyl cis-trans isomerase SurA
MKNSINFLLFIFISVLFPIIPIYSQTNVIDEVLWIVGDDPILKSEIEGQLLRLKYEGNSIEGDPYCVIAEQMAIQKLFLHQAKLDSITANEGTVSSQVEQRLNYFISQIGSKEKLEEYFGKSIVLIKEELHEQVREQMIIQQMQQKIIGDQKVSPFEVRKYFNAIPPEKIPIIPTKVEVQIITFEPKASLKEVENIKDKLRTFKERIESGDTDFSILARLYSEDIESAKLGGELGFLGRAQLVPEFAEVAFSLQDDKKVSRIVETDFGFHIIQLIERRGERVNCRHILLKPRIALAEKNVALEKLDSIATAIRAGKISFEQAALQFSQDKNTRASGGLMVNPTDGTSRFELKQLPTDIAKVVSRLNVNEISKPFIMTNQLGKEVCVVAKLKYELKEHTANLNDDYQELKNYLQEQKNAETLENWITKKQKETYISVNESFQNCEFHYPNWIKK